LTARQVDPRRIRVLWLIKGLGPGGAERLLVSAASLHDRRRFEIEVAYLLPWKNHLVGELERLDVRCTCLDVSDERDLRWVLRLRRLMRSRQFDIVHLHSPYPAAFARLAARSLATDERPALVCTEHNAWPNYKALTRLANALTAPFDDVILTVSDEVKQSIWHSLQSKSETLVHGVVIDDVRATLSARVEVRRELGVSDDALLIGTVANYHPKKDWPTLMHAARLVRDRSARVRFCAVGQGPLEADIKLLHRELQLEDTMTLTGYRPDAARLMAGCDAFVLASRWEGLPVAMMEACALGLPIIATAVGGIREHFSNGRDALLVPPQRPDELAKAILDLEGDAALRARLADASLRHSRDFDMRRTIARIEEVYLALAAQRARPR
jgi:glycosyltransferase involved in cell wall biosynthesis